MLRIFFTVENLVIRLKNVIRERQMNEEENRENIRVVLLGKRRTTATNFDYL